MMAKDSQKAQGFTPGPSWVYMGPVQKCRPGIESTDDQTVVIFGDDEDMNDDAGVRGTTTEQALANAQLISAAPELYEALRDCCAALGGIKANPDAIPESAKLALAKAEGRLDGSGEKD